MREARSGAARHAPCTRAHVTLQKPGQLLPGIGPPRPALQFGCHERSFFDREGVKSFGLGQLAYGSRKPGNFGETMRLPQEDESRMRDRCSQDFSAGSGELAVADAEAVTILEDPGGEL